MLNPNYESLFRAILEGEDVELLSARDTAYDWHGGQWSALYSFASTDCTVHNEGHRAQLEGEISECMGKVESAVDLDALQNLLNAVRLLPARDLDPEV